MGKLFQNWKSFLCGHHVYLLRCSFWAMCFSFFRFVFLSNVIFLLLLFITGFFLLGGWLLLFHFSLSSRVVPHLLSHSYGFRRHLFELISNVMPTKEWLCLFRQFSPSLSLLLVSKDGKENQRNERRWFSTIKKKGTSSSLLLTQGSLRPAA